MKKKNLLTEAQITRFAAMAGIPALGRISEKVDIQAEGEHKEEEEKVEEVAEETTTEEAEATNEEVVAEEEELDMDAEAPAGEEVSQEKIESLVDAVLAAIEAETGVPAQRVDDEEPADEAPAEEPAEEPEADLGEEEPEEEVMEDAVPSLAERIAAAVQSILDEDSALEEAHCSEDEEELEEGSCTNEDEEDLEEGYGKKDEDEEAMEESTEDQLEEITKADAVKTLTRDGEAEGRNN